MNLMKPVNMPWSNKKEAYFRTFRTINAKSKSQIQFCITIMRILGVIVLMTIIMQKMSAEALPRLENARHL